jgi:hypothetical protein
MISLADTVDAAVPIDLGTKPFVEYPTLGNAAFVDAWERLDYLRLLAAMDGGVGQRTPVQPRYTVRLQIFERSGAGKESLCCRFKIRTESRKTRR